ncbi:MAG: type II secretion system protein M [Gammaproteobacteria bacterium]|nr:type II secretion system protein M [Gammaproteobacteria bacterium]
MQTETRSSLEIISEQLNKRSARERIILLLTGIAILYAVADALLFSPLTAAHKNRQALADAAQQKLSVMTSSLITAPGSQLAARQQRLTELQQQLQQSRAALAGLTRTLTTPEQMTTLIRELTGTTHQLTVLALKNSAPQPIAVTDPAAKDLSTAPGHTIQQLYRHGVSVTLKGDFSHIVRFLRGIESQQQRMLLRSATVRSDTAPYSIITLELYTLSTQQTWLEV